MVPRNSLALLFVSSVVAHTTRKTSALRTSIAFSFLVSCLLHFFFMVRWLFFMFCVLRFVQNKDTRYPVWFGIYSIADSLLHVLHLHCLHLCQVCYKLLVSADSVTAELVLHLFHRMQESERTPGVLHAEGYKNRSNAKNAHPHSTCTQEHWARWISIDGKRI